MKVLSIDFYSGRCSSSSSDSSPQKERTCLDNCISSSESDDHEPAATFPSRQKKYKQHFREEWKRDLSWLDNIKGKAFCKIGQKYLSNNKTNIERHGYGESHKKNECTLKQQPKINQNKKVQAFESKIRKIKIAELKIILFLCVHNLPFALITPLIGLIKSVARNDEIVKEIKCGRTKAAETINGVLAENFMEDMANCLRHNKFSLIIDESTDISTSKCLGVVARYFDQQNGKIRDRFLRLIEVQKCDA
ncbi:uncharacterized protein LOC118734808 isoform X2 [Rhagoletis pomonella]|uniref:uncharacterized protein LOC118734808 isoform X2 n=1 Tax=Rhagoletis pomonella TaxID=28610 RepID=UPI00178150F8|nr:uncharacterized protein LOC118734808 isoform X2 [Rhagoletis pomonella]